MRIRFVDPRSCIGQIGQVELLQLVVGQTANDVRQVVVSFRKSQLHSIGSWNIVMILAIEAGRYPSIKGVRRKIERARSNSLAV